MTNEFQSPPDATGLSAGEPKHSAPVGNQAKDSRGGLPGAFFDTARAIEAATQAVIERANLRSSCIASEICVSGPCSCAQDIAEAAVKAYLDALTTEGRKP